MTRKSPPAKVRRAGSRHLLLFYSHSMDRVWKYMFALGAVVSLAGGLALVAPGSLLDIHTDFWLFILAVSAFALSAFAFVARRMAYVQARDRYLVIVTPFLRLRVGYPRIRSVHPTLIQQLFTPERLSWANRRFIEPFYGKTVLVVDLHGYPLSPALLKLFLPAVMFSPTGVGLVLLVPDWIELSTDIDSFYGAWLQQQGRGGLPR